mgnify:CR=1 FL=1
MRYANVISNRIVVFSRYMRKTHAYILSQPRLAIEIAAIETGTLL